VGVPSIRIREIARAGSAGVLSKALATHPAQRADFKVRVKFLSQIPRVQWTNKQFRSLKKGIFEIKWTTGKVEWRALGFDRDGYFVVVRCCTHKQNVYDPADCIDRAIELKKEAEKGDWEIREYEI
jgi:putative component of toxin-antitoxin plasmid stabilization module